MTKTEKFQGARRNQRGRRLTVLTSSPPITRWSSAAGRPTSSGSIDAIQNHGSWHEHCWPKSFSLLCGTTSVSPHVRHSTWKIPHVSHFPTLWGRVNVLAHPRVSPTRMPFISTCGKPSQKMRPVLHPHQLRGHAVGSKSAIRSSGTKHIRTVSCARRKAPSE